MFYLLSWFLIHVLFTFLFVIICSFQIAGGIQHDCHGTLRTMNKDQEEFRICQDSEDGYQLTDHSPQFLEPRTRVPVYESVCSMWRESCVKTLLGTLQLCCYDSFMDIGVGCTLRGPEEVKCQGSRCLTENYEGFFFFLS